MKNPKGSITRRNFLKGVVAGSAALGMADTLFSPTKVMAEELGKSEVEIQVQGL